MNYADKLRALAAWLDNHPDFSAQLDYDHPSVYAYASNSTMFKTVVRRMGNVQKSGDLGIVSATHQEGAYPNTVFVAVCSLSGACEKTTTGKITTRKVYIPADAYQGDDGNWYVAEQETEWKCPESFLNL